MRAGCFLGGLLSGLAAKSRACPCPGSGRDRTRRQLLPRPFGQDRAGNRERPAARHGAGRWRRADAAPGYRRRANRPDQRRRGTRRRKGAANRVSTQSQRRHRLFAEQRGRIQELYNWRRRHSLATRTHCENRDAVSVVEGRRRPRNRRARQVRHRSRPAERPDVAL